MKRIICITLCFLLFFSLCGCGYQKALYRSGSEYIVASIGFDRTPKGLNVILEAVIINSEDSGTDKKTELLKGTGENTDTAFADAIKSATEPVMLSHLGIAVLGESLSANDFDNIMDWFYYRRDTTLSAFFVTCETAEELLSCETVSSVAVGYDLVGLLEQNSNETGAKLKNRFFQLKSQESRKSSTLALPYFTVSDQSFNLNGMAVYENSLPVLYLENEQAFCYSLSRDIQNEGTVILWGEKLNITSCNTRYQLNGDTLEIKISLKNKENSTPTEKIRFGITELYNSSSQRNIDIFGIENIIYSRKNQFSTLQDYKIRVIINE